MEKSCEFNKAVGDYPYYESGAFNDPLDEPKIKELAAWQNRFMQHAESIAERYIAKMGHGGSISHMEFEGDSIYLSIETWCCGYADHESELMHYEVPDDMSRSVEASPDVMIYSLFTDHEPIGYKVPLIKVGDLY